MEMENGKVGCRLWTIPDITVSISNGALNILCPNLPNMDTFVNDFLGSLDAQPFTRAYHQRNIEKKKKKE